jgi:hypothetical protein
MLRGVTARVDSSRLEAWGLVVAVCLLLAFGAAFGVAVLRRPPAETADDGPGDPNRSYHADQAVDAWHDGSWYPAHVHAAGARRYFITYDGFSISWNEWVTARRLRKR